MYTIQLMRPKLPNQLNANKNQKRRINEYRIPNKQLFVRQCIKKYFSFNCYDINFENTDQSSNFVKCKNCESLRPEIFPSKNTIGYAYAGYYTGTATDFSRSSLRRIFKSFINRMRREYIDRGLTSETRVLLDYGCGSGSYLMSAAARNRSLKCYGTDMIKPDWPDGASIKWVSLTELEKIEPADLVTFSHVLEHLHAPDAALSNVGKIMAKGGQVWIATPNSNSILISLFGELARDVDFPRHRLIFSAALISTLLKNNGFNDVTFNTPSRWNDIANFKQCIDNVLKGRVSLFRKVRIIVSATCRFSFYLLHSTNETRRLRAPELIVTATKS